ncbi:MAG: mercuric transporter MerT family protein [Deferrisomatales bacterium]|nr:mercuric transporter MerT family protein [Deferrisomatales bacterium]
MERTTGTGAACRASRPEAGGRILGGGVAGALLSGLLASACCIGPLLAVFLGVTSAGALLALEPYRPLFAALMAAFLGFGFYRAYWLPRVAARRGESCCPPRALRAQRVVLWLAAALALALFFVPSLLLLWLE